MIRSRLDQVVNSRISKMVKPLNGSKISVQEKIDSALALLHVTPCEPWATKAQDLGSHTDRLLV